MTAVSLEQGLANLPVRHFSVTSDTQETFERVLACLYRLTSEGFFEVLSESYAEGAHALLATSEIESDVRFSVWGINGQRVVAHLERAASDLFVDMSVPVFVQGIRLSEVDGKRELDPAQPLDGYVLSRLLPNEG